MCYQLMPAMAFCSIGVLLTCLAIFQVRRERTEIHIRITKVERLFSEIKDMINDLSYELKKEFRDGIK